MRTNGFMEERNNNEVSLYCKTGKQYIIYSIKKVSGVDKLNRRKGGLLITFVILAVLLAGCINSETPAEKMYEVLENVVAAEGVFEEQQKPLVNLEQKEKELYDQIISLSMKDFDEIVKLSDEAIGSVQKREEHMQLEKESIANSKTQFEKLQGIIKEIEDEDLKKSAEQLYDTMMQRYENHETLYKSYGEAIQLDKELYELFKQEDLSLDALEAQIVKVNASYEQVLADNEVFNETTKQYNEQKLSFYKSAGLNVTTAEEEG